jgi:integrase
MLQVLLTGARSGEVVAQRWRDTDLQRAIWRVLEVKNGEPYDVMLPRQAVQLLRGRLNRDPVYVYPSPNKGRHIAQKAIGLAQYQARHGSPVADPIEVPWTVHDLRRTVATGLARLGCPRVVQDRILNHVDTSVGAIYDRHHYDREARDWLQRWADHLDALVRTNVVTIPVRKVA